MRIVVRTPESSYSARRASQSCFISNLQDQRIQVRAAMASDVSECKHARREMNSSLGQEHCPDCGFIFEEGTIVSEVQFQESGGRAVAQGKIIRVERTQPGQWSWMPNSSRDMLDYDSVTIHKVSKTLRPKAADLNFTEEQTNAAIAVYKLALRFNLTRGRKFDHCMAACLYIVCRNYKINLMLLDLSDYFRINVYTLGKTYLQISNGLHIATPVIEPTIYISRFAARLELGNKRAEVERTANRIVQRMNRDWMSTGRRPSGLCGAALLVAARMHNFNRTVKEMVKVVKICEATIRKRLMEFHDVPSSELSIEHFGTVSPSKEEDPPCYTEGKRRSIMAEQISQEKLKTLTVELSSLQEEIEKSLESSAKKPKGIWAKFAKMGDITGSAASPHGGGDDEIMQFLETEVFQDVLSEELDGSAASGSEEAPTPMKEYPAALTPTNLILGARHSSTSLGLDTLVPQCISKTEDESEDKEADDGELDLTGIDDKEIDSLLLTEEEARIKTEIWMKQNADILKELEEKEEQKAREMAENGAKPARKKRPNKKRMIPEAATPQMAVYQVIHDNKLSNKINYEVFKDLQPSTSSLNSSSTSATSTTLPLPPASPLNNSVEASRSSDNSTATEPPRKRVRRSTTIKPKLPQNMTWTSMSAQLSSTPHRSSSLMSLSPRASPVLSAMSRAQSSLGTAQSSTKDKTAAQESSATEKDQAETSTATPSATAVKDTPVTEKTAHAEEEQHAEEDEHMEDDEDLDEEEDDMTDPFWRFNRSPAVEDFEEEEYE